MLGLKLTHATKRGYWYHIWIPAVCRIKYTCEPKNEEYTVDNWCYLPCRALDRGARCIYSVGSSLLLKQLPSTFLDKWGGLVFLTPKHRETHGCVVSTVATDALVLKHQAISIHNADETFMVLDQFHIKILHLCCTRLENKITFWKRWPSRLRV